MMNKLIEEVAQCVEREYGRASSDHGPVNHSDHESYAVLLEEVEEARDEVASLERSMCDLWQSIKQNTSPETCVSLVQVQRSALLAACECIQVAAMAKKAILTIEERSE